MKCRGIRAATTVEANTRQAILAATRELLQQAIEANGVELEDVACILFTTTADLNAEFPALAARSMGLSDVPLLCGQEIEVPGSTPMCLRILILYNTEKSAGELVHVYTRGASELRSQGIDTEGILEG